jgi:hypothetical protein
MKTETRKLAKQLWSIGLKAKVKADGWDNNSKWENLGESQLAAWEAVANHVLELLKKRERA